MANPKKRTSSRKRNPRRSHIRLKAMGTVTCTNCQELKLRHRVCPSCGFYKDQVVVETAID